VLECTGGESNPYALRRRNLKTSENAVLGAVPQDSAGLDSEHTATPAARDDLLPRSATASDSDPVEVALATALTEASAAGRFDVVAQLAKELEARRVGRPTNVVPLNRGRRKS
jgi:hypothetical protein